MKHHPMLKYLKAEGLMGPRLPTILCPGCGGGQVLNYTLQAVDRLIAKDNIRKEEFLFISGVGCSSRITSHYLNFDSAWTIHGRALAVATGALLANPAFRVIVFTGDGDLAAIGGNHFIHACRRNINVTILCMNNGLYGMTGGQLAPTTEKGAVTTTTPYGNPEKSFDLCKLSETAGAPYVARWTTAHPRQIVRSVMKGIRKKGTAFIEVLSQCPVHKKMSPVAMLKMFKENTIPIGNHSQSNEGKIPIGEFLDIEMPEWNDSYEDILKEARGEDCRLHEQVMD
jgi:2-oxoglutarate/2-oxoacid ferredoxin oxidoreductase subunit beta